jgi:hypothetical protein
MFFSGREGLDARLAGIEEAEILKKVVTDHLKDLGWIPFA